MLRSLSISGVNQKLKEEEGGCEDKGDGGETERGEIEMGRKDEGGGGGLKLKGGKNW